MQFTAGFALCSTSRVLADPRTKTEQETPFERIMGELPLPKISSKYMTILQHHLVATGNYNDDNTKWIKKAERYESTNLILADSYGELEQLYNRKDDKKFLELYLRHMQNSTKLIPKYNTNLTVPEGMKIFMEGYIRGWLNHIHLGLWNKPPISVKELLERVDFLLENTYIDLKPIEEITDYEYQCLLNEKK